MTDRVYKKIEVVGTSSDTLEAAIQNAVGRAAQTVRNMRWFEVTELRGTINGDAVDQWQVTVKVGFGLEGDD